MKKKNLVVLLILPFIISLLCIITINTSYRLVDVDISFIEWEYSDLEAFELKEDVAYELKAVGVNQRHYEVSEGNNLVWTVENKNPENTTPCAEILVINNVYKLKPLNKGEVIITCSNLKGNVSRKMTGVIYSDAVILIRPEISSSQNNIDENIYYGEYDLLNGNKVAASFNVNVTEISNSPSSSLTVESSSENISVDLASGKVNILGEGSAFFTVASSFGIAEPMTYNFEIIDEGVNVYTYEDLLNCTNRSSSGEIVVLRKSFESLEFAYELENENYVNTLKYNNVECFGNYNFLNGQFNFVNEIHSFTTTYNSEFIEQWNEFVKNNTNYNELSDKINVGLRIQKDFYGNGYTINLHNLTYPYSYININDQYGNEMRIPQLTEDNLFRGATSFYTLGNPHDTPLISALGQDNIGIYIEGNNITVNDLNVKGCDFGNRLENLDTVGTVVEVYGNGNTIKNSRISNGRNVVRSFSSMDLTIDNCLLSYSRNFLFTTGSNEYVKINGDSQHDFTYLNGTVQAQSLLEFLSANAEGDINLNNYLTNMFSTEQEKTAMRNTINSIQSALNSADVKNQYKGSTTILNTYFYSSGIASICTETLFNGPFLYAASPTTISQLFSSFSSESLPLVPYTATQISGVSYPVKVDVKGNTKFFDYKTQKEMELNGLIEENISAIANSVGFAGEITIDDIFPLKSYVFERAKLLNGVKDDYFNVPVAYFGGGANYSQVNFDEIENYESYSAEFEVELLTPYLNRVDSGGTSSLNNMMVKTVTTVTGYEPFKFRVVCNGYLYGETPKVSDLVANANRS